MATRIPHCLNSICSASEKASNAYLVATDSAKAEADFAKAKELGFEPE
jgi:hypothetical protein